MEKKTRKKSVLITIIMSICIFIGIIAVIFTVSTYFMNIARDYDNKKYKEEQQELEQKNAQRNDNNILFKINDKYINQYGYITKSSNSSAIQILGINISDNQERLEEESLELLTELLKLRETFKSYDVLDKVNKIDVTDTQNIKVYMDSENKIIHIGNLENLSTKFVYIKNIMKQENGKKGTIFVNDINKVYFRESL